MYVSQPVSSFSRLFGYSRSFALPSEFKIELVSVFKTYFDCNCIFDSTNQFVGGRNGILTIPRLPKCGYLHLLRFSSVSFRNIFKVISLVLILLNLFLASFDALC